MINSRFRASFYRILAGDNGLFLARKMVISLNSIRSKGFESLNWPLHTSTNNDDDFAEIGLPVEKGGGLFLKLKTEKPEPFLKISGGKKKSHGLSVKSNRQLSMKDVSKNVENSPVPSLDVDKINFERSNFRSLGSVTIKNMPSVISLLQLKEAISVFGEVSKVFRRSVPNGLDCCDIEFKSMKSSRTALSNGSIKVNNFNLPIFPLDSLETVTIRISNISSKTADSTIHSTCKLYGPVEGLLKTKEDAVDAVFSITGEANTKCILKKLNCTVMDESKWSAHLQHGEPPSQTVTDNGNAEGDLGKFSEHLASLKEETLLKKICAEDLEYLHHSLLHLENHPLERRRPPKSACVVNFIGSNELNSYGVYADSDLSSLHE